MHYFVTQNGIEFTVEGILARLRAEGMRITKGRRSILEVLFSAQGPLSLVDIQKKAAEISPEKPDYATVFRLMTLLEQLRLAHKVNLQKSCSYYELNDPSRHYDHLVCRECGQVNILDLPCPVVETEKQIQERYGYTKLSHSLEFFGRCPECTAKQRVNQPAIPVPVFYGAPLDMDRRR